MSHLTPEPRADINGKVTTRWVRGALHSVSKSLFPAPPIAPAQNLPPETMETAPLFHAAIEASFNEGHGLSVSNFHPLAVQRIEAKLKEAQASSHRDYAVAETNLFKVLWDAYGNTAKWGRPENSTIINDISVVGLVHGDRPLLVLSGLRTYPEFRKVNDFLLDLREEGQERARALYKVASTLGGKYSDVYEFDDEDEDEDGQGEYTWEELDTQYIRLYNDDLAYFVMEHPDLTDEIIKTVRGRKTDDVAVIREVLNGPARVLGEGVL